MSNIKDATVRKNEQILMELLKDEANRHCADCGQKGTRWASWNLGVFLCIRCGGLHRKLGTHISKVKSVNLDKWTDEQVESMLDKGNAKVNASYNPNSERFPFPNYSGDMEQYIRDKYERKLFMAPDNRGATNNFPASRVNTSVSSSTKILNGERYPLQLKSLRDMGFTDLAANSTAINAAKGNLQEAVETLLSEKTGKLSFNDKRELKVTEAETKVKSPIDNNKSHSDDLVGIFGAPSTPSIRPPESSSSTRPSIIPPNSKSYSILDLELEPPHPMEFPKQSQPIIINREDGSGGAFSDEFEEFSSVPAQQLSSTDDNYFSLQSIDPPVSHNHLTFGGRQGGNLPPTKAIPTLKNIIPSSVAPDLSNPWASTNHISSNGDAFDDIDPFRGFTPDHRQSN